MISSESEGDIILMFPLDIVLLMFATRKGSIFAACRSRVVALCLAKLRTTIVFPSYGY